MPRKRKPEVIDDTPAIKTPDEESAFRAATFNKHLCAACVISFTKKHGDFSEQYPVLFRTLCDECVLNLAVGVFLFHKNINAKIPE